MLRFEQLGVALLLGLLVGLQRERSRAPEAGFRTFAILTVLGAAAAILAEAAGHWLLGAGLLGVSALATAAHFKSRADDVPDPGLTTEIAMIAMYVVGAFVVIGPTPVAVGLGAAIAVLLQLKPQLHAFSDRLTPAEVRAMMQFVVITCLILPLMPDRTYGPYDVFNPYDAWLMVALVVGINLGGYLIYRFSTGNAGLFLAGALGGLISSTATTASYSRKSKSEPATAAVAIVVILVASAIVYPRLVIEMAVVSPTLAAAAWAPFVVAFAVQVTVAIIAWRIQKIDHQAPPPAQKNPGEIGAALVFAAIYVAVLLGLAFARDMIGDSGLYVVAGLSGLTDVDAITLSTAQLVGAGEVDANLAWRVVMLATTANLLFKAGLVFALADRKVKRAVAIGTLTTIVASIATILLWPAA